MIDTDLAWLSGLTDGEGCFSLHVSRRQHPHLEKLARRVAFEFRIGLRADDVGSLIEARRILGVGRISHSTGRQGDNRFPVRSFYVNSRDDITKIIEFFRKSSLRSKKQRDFVIWSEAFEYFQVQPRGSHGNIITEGCFREMLRRSRLLSETRRYDASLEQLEVLNPPNKEERISERLGRTLVCSCGCGETFRLKRQHKPSHLPKMKPSHGALHRSRSQNKKCEEFLREHENDICACGCRQKIKVTRYHFRHKSKIPIFCHGHNRRKCLRLVPKTVAV